MSEERGAKAHIPLLISSLLVSFFLWAAVYAQNLPALTRKVDVDLLIEGLDATRFAVVKRPTTIAVWVTGSEQQINELRDMQKFGLVELSQAAPGARAYPVALQPSLLRELAHDNVPEIKLDIQTIERKKLRISPQTTEQLPSKELRLDSLVSEPESVTVVGPKSVVDQVVEARVSFDLSQADPKRAAPHVLPVEVVDDKGRGVSGVEVTPRAVAITPVLVPAPEEKTASVLVRFKGRIANGYEQAGYRLDPDSVVLVGPSFALATVSSIETQPIDISGLTGPRDFTTQLRLPTGVTSTRPSRVRVRVLIRRAPAAPPPAQEKPPVTAGGDTP